MKRKEILIGILLGCIVLCVGVVVMAATTGTEEPNTVMNWLVTAGATVVAVPLVNLLKKLITKWLGESLSGKAIQLCSWIVCYAVALIGYIIGGAVTGIPVFQVILTSGWAIFASGSAVSILANLAYNILSTASSSTA